MFEQTNGLKIEEGSTYRSHVGDLVKILSIDKETNMLKVYNISESCHTWHRIDSAIKDNKFKDKVA
jgi:mRNA-degrading endonuclease RelE of RelBE toxin-antitoxin system